MRTFEIVVFEGDRIDAARQTMQLTANDSWFNIGCAGHTLSKLRLTQNTIHGPADGRSRGPGSSAGDVQDAVCGLLRHRHGAHRPRAAPGVEGRR